MRIKVIEKPDYPGEPSNSISQKLIMPKEDPVNGYHDFSEEDMRNLIIISPRLRRLDFPVSDIRHIPFVFQELLPTISTGKSTP